MLQQHVDGSHRWRVCGLSCLVRKEVLSLEGWLKPTGACPWTLDATLGNEKRLTRRLCHGCYPFLPAYLLLENQGNNALVIVLKVERKLSEGGMVASVTSNMGEGSGLGGISMKRQGGVGISTLC